MVRELLRAQPAVCLITDSDGRTPLHLAAMEGRVEIMKELLQWEPKAIEVVLYGGETILHWSVKHGRLEALKLLLQCMHINFDDHHITVNSRDDDGNTVLHLAVAKKQIQIIELLLRNGGVEVNALNRFGFTALDILLQSPRELKDIQLIDLLQGANALRGSDVLQATNNTHVVRITNKTSRASDRIATFRSIGRQRRPSQISDLKDPFEQHEGWLERKRNTLMVVASLIATMAFQGGVNPPGGVWQDDSNGHIAGTSVMSTKHQDEYNLFMLSNTVGFITSLSVTLLLISGIPLKKKLLIWILMLIMWLSLTSMSIAYYLALLVTSPSNNNYILPFSKYVLSIKRVSVISIIRYAIAAWVLLLCIILVVHVLRFIVWLLKVTFKCIFSCR